MIITYVLVASTVFLVFALIGVIAYQVLKQSRELHATTLLMTKASEHVADKADSIKPILEVASWLDDSQSRDTIDGIINAEKSLYVKLADILGKRDLAEYEKFNKSVDNLTDRYLALASLFADYQQSDEFKALVESGDNSELQEKFDQLQAEYAKHQANYQQLQSEHEAQKTEHDKLQSTHQAQQTEHDNLKTAHDELIAKCKQLEANSGGESAAVPDDYEECKANCERLESELKVLELRCQENDKELETAQNNMDSAMVTLNKLFKEYTVMFGIDEGSAENLSLSEIESFMNGDQPSKKDDEGDAAA